MMHAHRQKSVASSFRDMPLNMGQLKCSPLFKHQQHSQAGSDLESPCKQEKENIKVHLEQGHQHRHVVKHSPLEGQMEDNSESTALKKRHWWSMNPLIHPRTTFHPLEQKA